MSDIFRNLARHAIGAPADVAALPNAEEIHNVSPRRSLDWPDDQSWRGLEPRGKRPDTTPQKTGGRKTGGTEAGQTTSPREGDGDAGSEPSEDPEHVGAARRLGPSAGPDRNVDRASLDGTERRTAFLQPTDDLETGEALGPKGPRRQSNVVGGRDDASGQLIAPESGQRPRPTPLTIGAPSQEDRPATDAIPPSAERKSTTGRRDAQRRDLLSTGHPAQLTPPAGGSEDLSESANATKPPVAQRKIVANSELVAAANPQAQKYGATRTPPASSAADPPRRGPDAQMASSAAANSDAPADHPSDAAGAYGYAARLDAAAGRNDLPAPTNSTPGPQGQDDAPVKDAVDTPPRAGAPHSTSRRQTSAPVEQDAARKTPAPITAEARPVMGVASVPPKAASGAPGASVDTPRDAQSKGRGGEHVRRDQSGQGAEEEEGVAQSAFRKQNDAIAVQGPRSTSRTAPARPSPTRGAKVRGAAEPIRFPSETAASATRHVPPYAAFADAPEAEGRKPHEHPAQAEKGIDLAAGPKVAAPSDIRRTPPYAAGIDAPEAGATTSPTAPTAAQTEGAPGDVAARDSVANADGRLERAVSAPQRDPDSTAAEPAARPPLSSSDSADQNLPRGRNARSEEMFDRTPDPRGATSRRAADNDAPGTGATASLSAPTAAQTESAPEGIPARHRAADETASTRPQLDRADAEKMMRPSSKLELEERPSLRTYVVRVDGMAEPRQGPDEAGLSDRHGAPPPADEVARETGDIPLLTALTAAQADKGRDAISARGRAANDTAGDMRPPNKVAAEDAALSDKSRLQERAAGERAARRISTERKAGAEEQSTRDAASPAMMQEATAHRETNVEGSAPSRTLGLAPPGASPSAREEAISRDARRAAFKGRGDRSPRALTTGPSNTGETLRAARSEGRPDDPAGSADQDPPQGADAGKGGDANGEAPHAPARLEEYDAKKKIAETSQPAARAFSAAAGTDGAHAPKPAAATAPKQRPLIPLSMGTDDKVVDPQTTKTHPAERLSAATASSIPATEQGSIGKGPPTTTPAAPPHAHPPTPGTALYQRGGDRADAAESAARKTPTVRLGVFHVSTPPGPPAKRRTRPSAERSLTEILDNRRLRR